MPGKSGEAAETIRAVAEESDRHEHAESFRRQGALLVAVLAALLAVATVLVQRSIKHELNNSIRAADTRSTMDVTTDRLTSVQLAIDSLTDRLSDTALPATARSALQPRLDAYRADAARLQSDPATGNGITQLADRVQQSERAQRDEEARNESYEFAEVLFEIAIVLGSVSILALSRPVLGFTLVSGGAAVLFLINGLVLFVHP